ncbi:MAG: hypothetical protein ACRCYU_19615 [Nocardioides sp.]
MTEYQVGFEITCPTSLEDFSQRFYDTFDDSILAERSGQITVRVYQQGEAGETVARRVIEKLERLGASVVRVAPDLVDVTEIAERLGRTRQGIHQHATGGRGSGFPRPIDVVGAKRIWTWGQITEWLVQTGEGLGEEGKGLSLDDVARVDAYLASRRSRVTSGTMLELGQSHEKPVASDNRDYARSTRAVRPALARSPSA